MSILQLGPLIEFVEPVQEVIELHESSSFASSDYMWTSSGSESDDLSSASEEEDQDDMVMINRTKRRRILFPYVFRTDKEADALLLQADCTEETDYFTETAPECSALSTHHCASSSSHCPPQVLNNITSDNADNDDISEYTSRSSARTRIGQKRKRSEDGLPLTEQLTLANRAKQDEYLTTYITSRTAKGRNIGWQYLSVKLGVSMTEVKQRWRELAPIREPVPVTLALYTPVMHAPLLTLQVPIVSVPTAANNNTTNSTGTTTADETTPETVSCDSSDSNPSDNGNTTNATSTTAHDPPTASTTANTSTTATNTTTNTPLTQAQLDGYILDCVHLQRRWLLQQSDGFLPLWRQLGVELGTPVKTFQSWWRDRLRTQYCQRIGSSTLSGIQDEDTPTSPTVTLTPEQTDTLHSTVSCWRNKQRGLWAHLASVLDLSAEVVMQLWSTVTPVAVQEKMVRQACVVLSGCVGGSIAEVTSQLIPKQVPVLVPTNTQAVLAQTQPSLPPLPLPSSVAVTIQSTAIPLTTNTPAESAQQSRRWHSTRHNTTRCTMTQDITKLLIERRPNHTSDWLSRLPPTVKRLEQALYYKADSLEMYVDRNTLKRRLQEAVRGTFGIADTVPDRGQVPTTTSTTTTTALTAAATSTVTHANTTNTNIVQQSIPQQLAHPIPAPVPAPTTLAPVQSSLTPHTLESPYPPRTLVAQPWHNTIDHDIIRANMVPAITDLLMSRCKEKTVGWLQRLPHLVKYLEETLYHEAQSMLEYCNQGSLGERLQRVAVAISSKPSHIAQPATITSATAVDCAANIPTQQAQQTHLVVPVTAAPHVPAVPAVLAHTLTAPTPIVCSTPLSAVPYHPTWHSSDHAAIRASTAHTICGLLKTRNTTTDGTTDNTRLMRVAKRLEDCLYQRAVSYEEYVNSETLKDRLRVAALAVGGTKQSTQVPHIHTVPAVGSGVAALQPLSSHVVSAPAPTPAPPLSLPLPLPLLQHAQPPLLMQSSQPLPAPMPLSLQPQPDVTQFLQQPHLPPPTPAATTPRYEQLLSQSQHAHELYLLRAQRVDMQLWDAFKTALLNKRVLDWNDVVYRVGSTVVALQCRWPYITNVLQSNNVPVHLYMQNMQYAENMQNTIPVNMRNEQNRQVVQTTSTMPLMGSATTQFTMLTQLHTYTGNDEIQNPMSVLPLLPPPPPLAVSSAVQLISLPPTQSTAGEMTMLLPPPVAPAPSSVPPLTPAQVPVPTPPTTTVVPLLASPVSASVVVRTDVAPSTCTAGAASFGIDQVVITAASMVITSAKVSEQEALVPSVVSDGSVDVQQEDSDDDVVYVSPLRVSRVIVDLTGDD